jgi:hypothetical protein
MQMERITAPSCIIQAHRLSNIHASLSTLTVHGEVKKIPWLQFSASIEEQFSAVLLCD